MPGRPRLAARPRSNRRARRCGGHWARRSQSRARRSRAAPVRRRLEAPLSDRRLAVGAVLEGLEAPCHRARKAWRLVRRRAHDQQVEPPPALVVGGHAVFALEDRLLDPAVRRDLDRVPDREPVGRHDMVRLVDAAVDRESQRPGLGGRAQPRRLARDVDHEAQLKLGLVGGRERVAAALKMDVADRPPVGAWGHTYREEWSPDALAAVTVERARRYGWDFVKFQPRASCFAEAFGSVYHPSGHRLRGPILIKAAVPDLEAWSSVRL